MNYILVLLDIAILWIVRCRSNYKLVQRIANLSFLRIFLNQLVTQILENELKSS
ncbi:hypothetical protein M758_12G142700 [Ceratodon purpureus]|nr:hypothetical protein M758_12G142700 [Ceratodon purpureus]